MNVKKETNRPAHSISDGAIKAHIWKRESSNGAYYATTFSKTYKDKNGKFQNSQNFTGTDLLKVAELAKQSYQISRDFYYQDRLNEKANQHHERFHDRER